MDVNSREFVDALAAILEKECGLYEKYITLLDEERGWLTRFNEARVLDLSAQRARLYDQLLAAQDTRLTSMRQFPTQHLRLRDLVVKDLLPHHAKRLLPLVDRLRALVKESQQKGRQHHQILDFGLKTVHGLLSIIWSATQTVVQSYNRQGGKQQSYQADKSRSGSVLREA